MTVIEFKTKWRKPVVKNRPNDGDDVFDEIDFFDEKINDGQSEYE